MVLFKLVVLLSCAVVVNADGYIRVCYYSNWAQYRPVPARMTPDKIDPELCTHIIYAFAELDLNSELNFTEWNDGDMVKEINKLKREHPNLRTLIAVGGYNQGSKPISDMTANRSLRTKFVRTAIDFMKKWGFDGLDLDWEFPVGKGGRKRVDKKNFISLLKELRQAIEDEPLKYLLTAAVSAEKSQIDKSYDIPEMVKYLDFINLMSYDFHGGWEKTAEHNSPLYPRPEEEGAARMLNVDWAAKYWVQQGTPKEMLIIGLPTYGRHYKLSQKSNNDVGAPIKRAGKKGPYTKEDGFLAYYEVCELVDEGELVLDQTYGTYLLHGDHWIGYDNENSFIEKLEYIKREGYGGAMVWTIDLDDFDKLCPHSERRFPLISIMKDILGVYIPNYMPDDYYFDAAITAADNNLSGQDSEEDWNQNSQEDWNQNSQEDWNRNSQDQSNIEYKRVCYFTNWAQYRQGEGKYLPRDIDPSLCTHLIYSFAKLEDSQLATFEWNDETLYAEFNGLKTQNPNLKTLLATGGWNAGSKVYSDMVADTGARRDFVLSSVGFLRHYGFDGLDMDWEYPALRGGVPEDKENFIKLLEELRDEFDLEAKTTNQPRLLLTAAVAAGKNNIDAAYDIPGMAKYLDFINLMSYDLHGHWEAKVGHNSPLYPRLDEKDPQNQLNTDWAAKYWVQKGTPREKLIIGLALYGRSFQLSNINQNGIGAASGGAGRKGQFTGEPGLLAYYEVCQTLTKNGVNRVFDNEHKVPYLVDGDQWVGYDDMESLSFKLQYIKANGFGGAMVWAIDMDDFHGNCGKGKYPLMNFIKNEMSNTGNTQSRNDYQDNSNQNPAAQTQPPPTAAGPTQGLPQTAAPTQLPPQTAAPTQRPTQTAAPPQTNAPSGISTPEELCKVKPTGNYAHPSNCAMFVTCVHGGPVIRPCAPGLHWNSKISNCDFPHNAQCEMKRTLKTESGVERSALETLLRKLDMKMSGMDSESSYLDSVPRMSDIDTQDTETEEGEEDDDDDDDDDDDEDDDDDDYIF